MLLRCLVVVGWMGLASLAVNVATAEDAVAPVFNANALDGVSFADPLSANEFGSRFDLGFGDSSGPRFMRLNQTHGSANMDPRDMRRYEVELVARGAGAGLPVDIAVAQRASMSVNENGDIEREGRGTELRLGTGLGNMRRREGENREPTWYIFAASDDEALTWQPGIRNAFGGSSSSFALQDQVKIGDMQAGLTYERAGVRASLAYVEREVSVQTGARSFSQDQSFTGLTLTMRH